MQIAVSRSIQRWMKPLERQCMILVKSISVIVSNLLNCSLCEKLSGQFREQTQALLQWPVFAVFTLCSVFAIRKTLQKKWWSVFFAPCYDVTVFGTFLSKATRSKSKKVSLEHDSIVSLRLAILLPEGSKLWLGWGATFGRISLALVGSPVQYIIRFPSWPSKHAPPYARKSLVCNSASITCHRFVVCLGFRDQTDRM